MAYLKASVLGLVALVMIFLAGPGLASADNPESHPVQASSNFVYTVQTGDTLVLIALRFNLDLAELILTNDLLNANLLFPGQKLVLPDSSALSETMSLAGEQLYTVQPGDTLLNIAYLYELAPGDVAQLNQLSNPDILQVGQTLRLPLPPELQGTPLRWPFEAIAISEPAIIQGRTLVIQVHLAEAATLKGDFEGQPLFFGGNGSERAWTIIPIHALMEPEIYSITLTATLPDGRAMNNTLKVKVVAGPYASETISLAEGRAELLEPELVAAEQAKLVDLWSQITLTPYWEGPFDYPVSGDELRVTSSFGTRRNYNGNGGRSFHGGTDFGGGTGTPIYAPAAGKVVLAEALQVRGNAVLLDHGLGLYSGYWHQSQIVVQEGQQVEPGDLIGYVGDTGLVTGPHLHWELRLNGIAVEPLQWVLQSIP